MGKTRKQKRGRGQPTKFSVKLAQLILELARKGKTDEQIAKAVGISRTTLHNWKGAHPDFVHALKTCKSVANGLVEASLFQRAVGYSHPAVKIVFNNETERFHAKRYVERYPPDTVACIFWLKNREPKRWRERSELTGRNGKPLVPEGANPPAQVIIELPAKNEEKS